MFGVGISELLILLALGGVGLGMLAVVYFVVRAAVRAGRNE